MIANHGTTRLASNAADTRARSEHERGTLFLLPALTAGIAPGGAMVLTRKFVDGVIELGAHWPGRVVVLIEMAKQAVGNLDLVEIQPAECSFGLEPLPISDTALIERLKGGGAQSIVMASLVDKHTRLRQLCAAANVPLVVYTEYTLQTRKQVVNVNTRNPILRWRRHLWETQLERQIQAVIRACAGLQCNGTPTFNAYRGMNSRSLLYFDSRVRHDMLAGDVDLAARTAELRQGGPLRLAFSGRLTAMKGAEHLPLVARELDRLGVPFTLDICGGGDQESAIASRLQSFGLSDCVRMRGVLDFKSELMPFVTRHVDLFVCCHRQGDPSCTYLETMSCGTPIVGYANEAMEGVVGAARVGWTTPLDDPKAMAEQIAAFHKDRNSLIKAAFAARAFAAEHTFEDTMRARVNHLLSCCGAPHPL